MIAILVAVKQELKPILARADARHIVRQQHLDFYEGTLGGKPVALLALGIGKECARIAAEMTIRCYRPDLIISAGFGGGLLPEVREGDIVIGTEVLDLSEDMGSEVCFRSSYALPHPPSMAINTDGFHIHHGKIITADDMVLKAATKSRLGKMTGALTVDMETSAVAAVARARQTEFMAIRCITDNDHEDLPAEFNDFFVLGQLQPSRVMAACVHSPRVLGQLARLGYRAKTSGANLARFLEEALSTLHLPALAARDL